MVKIGTDVIGTVQPLEKAAPPPNNKPLPKIKVDKYGCIYIPKSLVNAMNLNPGDTFDLKEFSTKLQELIISSERKSTSPNLKRIKTIQTEWGNIIKIEGRYLATILGFDKLYGFKRSFVSKKREGYLVDDLKVNSIIEEGLDFRKNKIYWLVEDITTDEVVLRPLDVETVINMLKIIS